MRLQAAVDEYLAALRGRHAPSTTIKAYASDLRPFVNAAPAELSRIDTEPVLAFFRWLVQLELVDLNPVDRVAPARTVVRLPRPLDNQQVREILEKIPASATRDRAHPPLRDRHASRGGAEPATRRR